MKWIVITSPDFLPGEVSTIDTLFRSGIDLLHVRKPTASADAVRQFLATVPTQWLGRIVLHDHFHLVEEFPLHGIHLNRRNPQPPAAFHGSLSASCHSLAEVAERKTQCDYVFLSPIFNSISKTGYHAAFQESVLRQAAHSGIIDHQVVALGGVTASHLPYLKSHHFGGAAFLGDIWQRITHPSFTAYLQQISQEI